LLPNKNISVVYGTNTGYQRGAIQGIIDLVYYGWSTQYNWIIRINPDVMILDEIPLLNAMNRPGISLVLADCGAGHIYSKRLIHSDFFAAKNFELTQKILHIRTPRQVHAEKIITHIFSQSIKMGRAAWLASGNDGSGCRIRPFSFIGNSGIQHAHYENCTKISPRLKNNEGHYYNNQCGDKCVNCVVHENGTRPLQPPPCQIWLSEPEYPPREFSFEEELIY